MPKSYVALVTGGNRGIGLAVCRGLAAAGLRVAMGSRDGAAGERAMADLESVVRGRIKAVALDVTKTESVRAAVDRIQSEWGGVDVLVNNAGVYLDESESGLTVPIADVQLTLETNVVGALGLCQSVVPGMRKRGYGRIVNISSGYGQLGSMDSGGVLAYKISKLALNAMTRILAAELRGTSVLINAMDPGWVRTRMGGPSAHRTPEQAAETAIYLATLPANGPSGKLFRDRRAISW